MIFDCNRCCAVAETVQLQHTQPFLLAGAGLWAGVISRGRCVLEQGGAVHTGAAGDLLLTASGPTLRPMAQSHLLLVRLTGTAADLFLEGLPAPQFVNGVHCPTAAELLDRLSATDHLPPRRASLLGYELLCELGGADEPARTLPPLVAEALTAIHENYMSLYGVEELSEQLGVSKSHLVRAFSAAMGVTPGRYLIHTRVEAVKLLLLDGEHNLETAAALCGFSGANYLCRVFKRETGLSPAAWRAANQDVAAPRTPYAVPRQDEIYV